MILSIITATYNSRTTISDCILSVFEQKFDDLEYRIVDGGSTDGTRDLVLSFQQGIPNFYFISEPDKGIYDALNKGIRMATGDVIGFVHSDDFLAHPGVLSRIARCFEDPKVAGVYGDLLYVDKNNTDKVVRKWKSKEYRPGLLRRGWMPAHPTLYLRKTVYEKHGYFDLNYRIAADYDFMLRILRDPDYRFLYLPEVLVKMRVGGASNRSFKNLMLKSREDLRALRANGIPNPIYALFLKNISKIPQFLSKAQ